MKILPFSTQKKFYIPVNGVPDREEGNNREEEATSQALLMQY